MYRKISSILALLLTSCVSLYAESDAKQEVTCKEGYEPWYTGPIVAASANCLYPGEWNVQPYLYFQDTYGMYDQHWGFHSVEETFSVISTCSVQTGITNWMDTILNIGTTYNQKEHRDAFGFMDLGWNVGFQIVRQKKKTFIPSIKVGMSQLFPTGKYENLSPDKLGIDAMGGGSYTTRFFLNISKVQYWWIRHPLAWRLNFAYHHFTDVTVHGFNAYGGGYGTKGKVKLGYLFSSTFSFEYSFTQRWVLALDTVFVKGGKTKFSGNPGTNADGSVASNTLGDKWQVSLAPALEYNISENGGFIAGFWATADGNNASAFMSGVISFTYTF